MLPALTTTKATKEKLSYITKFGGYNAGLQIEDNEFNDMLNMTNDYYPVFANRKKRGIVNTLTAPQGVAGGDKFSYVDNDKLYYDNSKVLDLSATGEERQLVMMGAYLCVFPDGVVYNTISRTSETIENSTTASNGVTMTACTLDGTDFTSSNTFIQDTEPTATSTKIYWIDTSNPDEVILKMWSDTYSMWTSVPTTYVKIAATGIGTGFKDYDSATFSGITIKGYNDYEFNDTLIIYKASTDYLIVAGLIDLQHTQSAAVNVKRELPKMDFVCELNNRLFGCRYGTNNANEFVNEIYACKLGDPTNWNAFAGLSTDSYIASCGSEGEFTGIAAYSGSLFFFKEDGYHKLYGSQPSNFQMLYRPCRGVALGCSKSIAVVNQVLFYKSRDAVVAFDGSENTISTKLGIEPFYEAVAVGYRNKYFISMRDVDYHWKMYVYDIQKGTWCIEDNLHALYMVYADNATYIIDKDFRLLVINNEAIYQAVFPHQIINEDNIITVDGVQYDSFYNFPSEELYPGPIIKGQLENTIEWSFTTGDLTFDNPYQKYLKRINLRISQDVNTKLKIEIEYDSSGEFEYVTELYSAKKRTFEVPVQVRRADHVRLRISGWGEFRLYGITKAVEGGSGEDES